MQPHKREAHQEREKEGPISGISMVTAMIIPIDTLPYIPAFIISLLLFGFSRKSESLIILKIYQTPKDILANITLKTMMEVRGYTVVVISLKRDPIRITIERMINI